MTLNINLSKVHDSKICFSKKNYKKLIAKVMVKSIEKQIIDRRNR